MLKTALAMLLSLAMLGDLLVELPKWNVNIGRVAMRAAMLLVFVYLAMGN